MVDMCMGKNKIVNFRGVKSQVAVHGVGLKSLALIHATVEQYFQSTFGGKQMFAAGNLAGSTHKLQFHIIKYFVISRLQSSWRVRHPTAPDRHLPREASAKYLTMWLSMIKSVFPGHQTPAGSHPLCY